MDVAYVESDNLITLTGLKNEATGSYVNSATVTATVKDLDGTQLAGQTWPTTMSYVSSSNGNYRGTLEDGASLVAGTMYVVEITADAGSDLIRKWYRNFRAEKG